MTTFYDHRAERAIAAGMAENQRAEAATKLAEAQLKLVEVETARANLQATRQIQADERKRAARDAARADRRARWVSTRDGFRSIFLRLRALIPFLVGGIAMGAPILIAWNGQLATAREVLHLGVLAPVLPIALEGGAWWLAYLVHRAIRDNLPTGRLRAWTWVLALIAAGMNFWHGAQAYGPVGGTSLALASLLGIGLWELTAGQYTNAASGRTAQETRLVWMRRLRYPRLSWAAASIAAAHGAEVDREAAWHAAWVDRFGVGPQVTLWERALGRTILRHGRKVDLQAAANGGFVIVGGRVQRGFAERVREFIDAELAAAMERAERIIHEAEEAIGAVGTLSGPGALRDGFGSNAERGSIPPEQHELTGRQNELMTLVRAAIDKGKLPQTPSVNAIGRLFEGFGVPTAQAVRDALRNEASRQSNSQEERAA
jgi:hypothetical protein